MSEGIRPSRRPKLPRGENVGDHVRVDPPPCPEYRLLGTCTRARVRYDLYFCLPRLHSIPLADPDWPTFMARFGPGENHFISGVGSQRQHPALREARRRAIRQGLHDPTKPLHPGMQKVAAALADLLVADLMRDLKPLSDASSPKRGPVARSRSRR